MNTVLSVRYDIEQHELPALYYSNRASFLLKMMGAQGDTIMQLYRRAEAQHPDYRCPYSEKEFLESHVVYKPRRRKKATGLARCEDVLILRVQLPEPEAPLHSRAVYLCYDQNSSDLLYLVSERTMTGSYVMCARLEDGTHVNYGPAPAEFKDEFDFAAELFMSRTYKKLPNTGTS